MRKITYNTELIKSLPIKNIIESETNLKFKKNTLSECPFCGSGTHGNNGKADSAFQVQPEKNIFTCFVCGKTGNPIEFIKLYKKLQNGESINYLAEKYSNMQPIERQENPKKQTDFTKKIYAISQNDKTPAADYLKSRAILADELPPDTFYYDSIGNAVVFVDSEKQLINKRFINPKPDQSKGLNEKDSKLNNAVFDKLYKPDKNTIFIFEGVINALSLPQHSSIAIFSTSNDFTNSKKLAKYIKGKNVVLALDNDTAGNKASKKLENLILKNIQVKTLTKLIFPENKDANDLLQKGSLLDFVSDSDNYEYIIYDIIKIPLKKNQHISNQYEIKDSHYKARNKNGNYFEISDCVLSVLYRFSDELGTRLIKAQQVSINGRNKIELFQIASKDLKVDGIDTALSKVGFSFFGSKFHLSHILKDLKHKEKQAELIETYGWQLENKMFLWSNCGLDSENNLIYPNSIGVITDKEKNLYLPTASPVKNKDIEDLKQFKYSEGKIDFKEFSKLFYLSNKENGSIGIQFYLLSLFRDIVFDYLDFFPYLYLYGEAGAGKTSYVDSLLGLFGDQSKGHALKSITQAGITRVASQRRNAMVYLKEYSKDVPNYVEDYLKTGYDGQARTVAIGGTSKNTVSYEVESSGVIDSNFLPTNETAVFTRMIILDFETTNFTTEQTQAYETLKQEEKNGLSQITKEILLHRELFESNFKEVFYTVLDGLKKNGLKKKFKHERTLKHIALILTPYHILESVLKFPYTLMELEDSMINHALQQEKKLNSFNTTNMFWQALAYYKQQGKVLEYDFNVNNKNVHFVRIPKDATHGYLYIKSVKLAELTTNYVSFCKSQGIDTAKIDKPLEIKSKLLSDGYLPFQRNINSPDLKTVQNKQLGTSSYCFLYTTKPESSGIFINNQEIDL